MPNEYRRKPTGSNRATWSETRKEPLLLLKKGHLIFSSGVIKENIESRTTPMKQTGDDNVETSSKILDKVHPVPVYGVTVLSKRKQHAEVLTSPENLNKVRNKTKIKDLKSRSNKESEKKEPKKKEPKGKEPKRKEPKGKETKRNKTKKDHHRIEIMQGRLNRKNHKENSDDSSIESYHISLHDSPSEIDIEYEILEDICVVCGEFYNATKKLCDWLQCVQCHMWFHEDCCEDSAKCLTCNV